jgi:hypothetical protein
MVYILLNSFATAYLLFCDYRVDWNVLNFRSHHFLLRNKITFSKKWYFFAIVSNLILRLTWITSLYKFNFDDEILFFILCLLEIYRRLQWIVFRVENEQKNNVEFYRKHIIVPELPDNFI